MNLVALRCGQTRSRGWHLSEAYLRQLTHGELRRPKAEDYELRFEQKGVDMRIGIDVATLALNRHVDRIIVATNDTDLIPALKLARRSGIQVVIAQIGSFNLHRDLVEDADFRRHYPVAA
ncbi:MAG: NYN domain-containing protein [Proteobacteria bacterium]|nr:NYN domain-containing protein [Pseudomonadota bacterium]